MPVSSGAVSISTISRKNSASDQIPAPGPGIPMPWLQLHLQADRSLATEAEDLLMACGAVSVTLSDNADDPILEPGVGETPLWPRVRITGLFEADADPEAITAEIEATLPGVSMDTCLWETLEDRAWERAWMDEFQPVRCGDRLWICPSWCQPPNPEAVNLRLDPGLAFGSGTHPTTFLCLQWLDRLVLNRKTVVDYGCGSGILGIAALLLGASRVIAVDNDPQALTATRANLERNQLSAERLLTCTPDVFFTVEADVVLANILAGPLLSLAPRLSGTTRPGGMLCLSGITRAQVPTVLAAYPAFDFTPMASQDDWVRLTAVKRAITG